MISTQKTKPYELTLFVSEFKSYGEVVDCTLEFNIFSWGGVVGSWCFKKIFCFCLCGLFMVCVVVVFMLICLCVAVFYACLYDWSAKHIYVWFVLICFELYSTSCKFIYRYIYIYGKDPSWDLHFHSLKQKWHQRFDLEKRSQFWIQHRFTT